MTNKRQQKPSRSNDEIRRLMLQYFYHRNVMGSSFSGKKGSHVRVSDLKSQLRLQYQLSQQEVMSNLLYLVSMNWVAEHQTQKMVPTRTGVMIPQTSSTYAITAHGIDFVEGGSEFTRNMYSGITIDSGDFSVITIGDGNTVNVKFAELSGALAELKEAVKTSKELPQEEILNAVGDIQTMQTQLAKPNPSSTVIQTMWAGLGKLATVNGVAALAEKVSTLIDSLPV